MVWIQGLCERGPHGSAGGRVPAREPQVPGLSIPGADRYTDLSSCSIDTLTRQPGVSGLWTLRMQTPFPFSAIVGQDEMKLAVLIAAVDAC